MKQNNKKLCPKCYKLIMAEIAIAMIKYINLPILERTNGYDTLSNFRDYLEMIYEK